MEGLDNKIFITDDDKQYEVIENIKYDSKVYLYLVNINDKMDSIFQELKIKNDEMVLEDINPNLFKSTIINLFLEKFKNY